MLRNLLDAEKLTCPSCRGARPEGFYSAPLALDAAHVEEDGFIVQGLLRCRGCGLRYPILDGVAVIFRDVGAWLRQQERPALWRDDLAPPLEHWLRGAWAEDQDPNWHRQMLAVYGGRLPTHPPSPEGALAAVLGGILAAGQQRLEGRRAAILAPLVDPCVLDAGCGVGEATFSASRLGARVIAIDQDMGALRLLARLLRRGRAVVPRWRHGGGDFVPEEARLPDGVDPRRVVLVAADLLDPPLDADTADVALAYHVLDNVARPVRLLRQLHAVLRPGGTLVCASPYDWSPQCTPIAERLGESIRAGDAGDPAEALRALLTGRLPELAPELAMAITQDDPALPWVLLRHRRSAHVYLTHYLEAVRPELPGGGPAVNR